MFQFILTTQDGEVIGISSDRSEAIEDAREVCTITREPVALHRTLEEECVLQVGDLVPMRSARCEWFRPEQKATNLFTSVRARANL